jgi:large subunit ribosomal protein L37Ae
MVKTKLAKSTGRFGIRYGISVRRRVAAIEEKQRQKQKCIFCNGRAKRVSKGIWLCKKCGKKFAGHAYYLEQYIEENKNLINKENKEKTKEAKTLKEEKASKINKAKKKKE